ncbi:MAG: excinuclease ABC subunit UvrA [Parachlamydiales bacterium]
MSHSIQLKKVRVHNLQAIDIKLAPNQLIVFTGVSGSGKSSLAFDTLYVEGQRRYVESLSTFARRYVGDLSRPELEGSEGLTPTISIEQKTAGRNPRSTVGTMTEVSDYLRVLYARCAVPYCPVSGEAVQGQSREQIIAAVEGMVGERVHLYAPIVTGKKGTLEEEREFLLRKGFVRARVDGELRELEEPLELDERVSHTMEVLIDRFVVKEEGSRVAEAVTLALEMGDGVCLVEERLFSVHAFSPKSGLSYPPLDPQHFSPNHPMGMCPECQGLGVCEEFDLERIIDAEKSIAEDCCSIAPSYGTVYHGNVYDNLARLYQFEVTTPWKKLPAKAKDAFLKGIDQKYVRMSFKAGKKRWTDYVPWKGVLHLAHQRLAEAKSEGYQKKMRELIRSQVCPQCKGGRLAAYPAAAKLSALTIGELMALDLRSARAFFDGLKVEQQEVADELLKEIRERLGFLLDVGLHYLTLDRPAPSLSGGEAQRVRLASQIGCGLVGVTYILDEPSIGLHPRDNKKLIATLERLRDRGNTVIVVEHDEETVWSADEVVDFGPMAGEHGGEIIYQGPVKGLLKEKRSLTGAYLSGRRAIPIPTERRKGNGQSLKIVGARHHNLQNLDVDIPLGKLIAVTGVSGSGKSSLISDILHPALAKELHNAEQQPGLFKRIEGIEHLDKVIAIDQTPIGRNPRSNPATYVKLFDPIRALFAELPESKARGYKPGRFSFNVAEGSCSSCSGMGMTKVDLDFLEEAYVTCSLCLGRRFDGETLSVLYKGKSIHDVLEMSVEEAAAFFADLPHIAKPLKTLEQVGMGYIKLGQSSTTLSGGEAQRIKLAKELSRPDTGKTLYLLDEPTTGLHFYDIHHLQEVLGALVGKGNTVVVIEHNMEVVKTADWVIELGPDGGAGGGKLVAQGTPEEVAKGKTPTASALAEVLMPTRQAAPKKIKHAPPLTHIEVKGASQHNLKNLNLKIPRGKLVFCTGPSGAGKSSFAFDTVYAEGMRRYTDSLSPYARQFVQQMPKAKVESIEGLSPAVAIEQKAHAGNPRSTVGTLTEIYDYLRILYARLGIAHCPETGERIEAISKEHVVDRLMGYPEGEAIWILAPIQEEALPRLARQGFLRVLLNGKPYELSGDVPLQKGRKNRLSLVIDRLKIRPAIRGRLFEAVETAAAIGENRIAILRGEEEIPFNLSFSVPSTGKSYPEITPRTFGFNGPDGMCPACTGLGCRTCKQERLNPLARHVLLEGISLGELCHKPISEVFPFLEALKMNEEDARLLSEVREGLLSRLQFLLRVGLGYLSLHRSAPTLSNGEAQRIRLARQLGTGLTGVLYVLDEPTVGLHASDSKMLGDALEHLKALGNTLLVVEHDPELIARADEILDFGPRAGREGGEVLFQGSLEEIKRSPLSLTGAYLSGRLALPPSKRRKGSRYLKVEGVTTRNLRQLSCHFPVGLLSCITGVSGSGKSTLMHEILMGAFEKSSEDEVRIARGRVSGMGHFDKVILLDQDPIGHTNRADLATYSEVAPHLRDLYASLAAARTRGLTPGHFSTNHPRGMCTRCSGLGKCKVEMHFLPPVWIDCPSCKGLRLSSLSLEVTYEGINLGQALQMSVDQAGAHFAPFPKIRRRLETLQSVGLGYVALGQGIATLSGGEAQRLKLAKELARRSTGATLYLLDEPTVGLHPDDLAKLVPVLQELVEGGNTLIIIEHNLDLIRCADHLVDLGPGAGADGGRLVAQGTPEQVAKVQGSRTGQSLKFTTS